jgi:hypothetical protein
MYEKIEPFMCMHCWKMLRNEPKWNDRFLELNNMPHVLKCQWVHQGMKTVIHQGLKGMIVQRGVDQLTIHHHQARWLMSFNYCMRNQRRVRRSKTNK